MKNQNIIKESSEQYKYYLNSIILKVKKELTNIGYNINKIDELLKQNLYSIDVIDNNYVLYNNNQIVVSKPSTAPFFSFIKESVDAIVNALTNELDKNSQPIDIDLNIFKENKKYLIKLTESELESLIKESINTIIRNISFK